MAAPKPNHRLHPALDALYAKHPTPAVQASLNTAYEKGLGDLKQVLETTTRPKPDPNLEHATRINELPAKFVHILNTVVLARCLAMTLPFYGEAVSKDERRITGGFAGQVQQFLRTVLQQLAGRGVFRAHEGTTALEAAQQYAEDLADLAYECLHELNNCPDPRQPHAAMRMYNELNMVEEVPETATEEA